MTKNHMNKILAIALFFTIVIFVVSQNIAEPNQDTLLTAYKTTGNITLDGISTETFWDDADMVTISDIGGSGFDVTVNAKHNGTHIFLFVKWTDDTMDNIRKQWEFNGTHWNNNGFNEDRITFFWSNASVTPVCGHYVSSPNPAAGFQGDVWHWKATRTGPAGWADDKYFDGTGRHGDDKDSGGYSDNSVVAQMIKLGNSSTEITSVLNNNSVVSSFKSGDLPYWDSSGSVITWVTGANTSVLTDTIGGQPTTVPVGSRGDVLVGSQHDGSAWYAEYARKLDTGHHDDDIVFSEGNSYSFSVAVHNKSGDAAHYTKTALTMEISSLTEPTTTTTITTETTTTTTAQPTTTTTAGTPGFFIPVVMLGVVTVLAFKRKFNKK